MKYIQSTLLAGEKITYTANVKPISYLWLFLLGGFLFLVGGAFYYITHNISVMIIGFLLVCYPIIPIWTTEIAITNKRVIHKFGLIQRRTTEITLNRIESINVHQSILGRLFGYGTIYVQGIGANTAILKGIDDPLSFRKAVTNALETNGANV